MLLLENGLLILPQEREVFPAIRKDKLNADRLKKIDLKTNYKLNLKHFQIFCWIVHTIEYIPIQLTKA